MKKIALCFLIVLICSGTAFAQWISGSNGFYGGSPLIAGYYNGGTPVYVCAALTSNGWQAGHLVSGQRKCYVAWGKNNIGFSNYSVLQNTGRYMWVNRNRANPNHTVKLSREGGVPTMICRRGDGRPGKVVHGNLSRGICYTSGGNRNFSHTNFDVLVVMQR